MSPIDTAHHAVNDKLTSLTIKLRGVTRRNEFRNPRKYVCCDSPPSGIAACTPLSTRSALGVSAGGAGALAGGGVGGAYARFLGGEAHVGGEGRDGAGGGGPG